MNLWSRAALWVRGEPWFTVATPAAPAHRTLTVAHESRTEAIR